ncbi:MAG: ATP synthase F1 subunit epsilon [Patescibacteria group bacterium]|nr:ATP synthase F1 subunit epsilon [Candidatus Beckwithbacteria bacterium]MDZ4228860.1 ATP synthase F1 subunit epsilon [Patescibacteria group bacterium]
MSKLHLEVLTQEAEIFSSDIDLVVAPGADGQIGILPGHVALLTQLTAGELYIFDGPRIEILAVGGGLLDVHNNEVSVMADSAVRADEIDIFKVEEAKKKAEEALKQGLSEREYALASADLRRAVFELKVARRRHLWK